MNFIAHDFIVLYLFPFSVFTFVSFSERCFFCIYMQSHAGHFNKPFIQLLNFLLKGTCKDLCNCPAFFLRHIVKTKIMKRKTANEKQNKQESTTTNAHKQADKDIAKDPDNIHSPNDDLDEGELARLGENPEGI